MKHASRCHYLGVLLVSAAVLNGCRGRGQEGSPKGQARGSVTALVAASAKDALAEVAGGFRGETGFEVKISSGASSTLAAQILNGAAADIFLSANEEWAQALEKKGVVLEMRPLLSNDLVIVVPRGNPAGVKSPDDLKSDSVKRVALAGEKVPAGKYAEQALGALRIYQGLVGANRIARGQDVRVALTYVERGEAEAGVVYSTDARISRDVEIAFTFDPKTYGKIVYPVVLIKGSRDNEPARKFYDYLRTSKAGEIFKKFGFNFISSN